MSQFRIEILFEVSSSFALTAVSTMDKILESSESM